MGRELFMACCDNDLARVATLLASEYEENPGKRKNVDVDFRMTNGAYASSGLFIWTIFMSIVIMPTCNMSSKIEIEFYDAEIYIVYFFWHANYNVFIPWRTIYLRGPGISFLARSIHILLSSGINDFYIGC